MGVVEEAISAAAAEMRKEMYKKEYKKQGYSKEYEEGISNAGVLAWMADEEEYFGIKQSRGKAALAELDKIVCFPSNVLKEIKIYRKYVPWLLADYRRVCKKVDMLVEAFSRISTDSETKKYKRWTTVEDSELIEFVCDDELSILQVSAIMGRTVPSIKTRISKLVGLKRISQEIAGRFVGSINGVDSDCILDGTLFKKS